MSDSRRPNIVLIMTDHFRRDAVGPSTPNLMRLAERGTQFLNAYCSAPLCQPSRTSLITGLYPSQNCICGNMSEPLRPELRDNTFMHHLQSAGYHTAMIGKHHYIDCYGLNVDVTHNDVEIGRYGFDTVFQVADAGENLHNADEYTHYLKKEGKLDEYRKIQAKHAEACGPYPFKEEECEDGFIGRRGCEFVDGYQEDRPFYLNLSFIGPHPPYWHPGDLQHKPEEMLGPIGVPDSHRIRERRAHYMDKCSIIDRCVGRLIESLEKRGILEDTVIVFISDHGDMLGDFGLWDKRFFYEASVGVPFIVSGPGIPTGSRLVPGISQVLVSLLDLYPTLLNLAGVDPYPLMQRRDGRDILSILEGRRGSVRTAIFAELATAVMIRTGNWKLVFDPEQGGVQQLFNLTRDPQELENLAGVSGYEQATSELVQQMLAHRIWLTQTTHAKEEQQLQRVRVRV